ncbi:MAG: DUF3787 domain-containing protein [Clostridioides sp.]|jgi:hypothetical protein|nr:DUF3787 domain-containing protein [Clostridioides sp.]
MLKNDKRVVESKNKKSKSKAYLTNKSTEAWADIEKLRPESKVPQPSNQAVEDAKDWVDNGSKL